MAPEGAGFCWWTIWGKTKAPATEVVGPLKVGDH